MKQHTDDVYYWYFLLFILMFKLDWSVFQVNCKLLEQVCGTVSFVVVIIITIMTEIGEVSAASKILRLN